MMYHFKFFTNFLQISNCLDHKEKLSNKQYYVSRIIYFANSKILSLN